MHELSTLYCKIRGLNPPFLVSKVSVLMLEPPHCSYAQFILRYDPTDPFKIFESQNPRIEELFCSSLETSSDESQILWKGRSGSGKQARLFWKQNILLFPQLLLTSSASISRLAWPNISQFQSLKNHRLTSFFVFVKRRLAEFGDFKSVKSSVG